MVVSATAIGIILDIIGALIFLIVNLSGLWHQKNYAEKWTKRYWWHGWRPFFKISPPLGRVERKIKLTRKVIVYGAIPPQHQWNIVGFLYIVGGSLLQLKDYLSV